MSADPIGQTRPPDPAGPGWLSLPLAGTDTAGLVLARRWCAAELGAIGVDHRDAVLLACTELLTNAYEHGSGPVALRLRPTRVPCEVRIEVDDLSPTPPRQRTPCLGEPGGRGLLMIDRLARAWGWIPCGSGKVVWATLACGTAPGNLVEPCPVKV